MKRRRLLSVVIMMIAVLVMSLNAQAAVKISKKKATLIKGQSVTLKISGTKGKVKWSTNKKKVATVTQKGVVKARAKGTATISAKVGKKTYKCKVRVETPKISKTKATLNVGQKLKLKITGNTQKVRWSSNKKTIVTVTQKGIVTGKKAGTATITAAIAKKKYTCRITVNKKSADISDASSASSRAESYYISDRGAWDTEEEITIVFKLKDIDGNELNYCSGKVHAIIIIENNSKVYDKKLDFSSKNYHEALNGNHYYYIIIPRTEVTNGIKAEGKIRFSVEVDDGAEYSEYEDSLSHLPLLDLTPKSISIVPSSITMTLGDKKDLSDLTVTILPEYAENKEYEWSVADEDIIVLWSSIGRIDAKKIGTTTLTATTKEGNVKASIPVTVTNPISIRFPEMPLYLYNYSSSNSLEQTYQVSDVKYEVTGSGYSGKFPVNFYFSGKKYFDYRGSNQSSTMAISWKLYDKNNNVVDSGSAYTPSLAEGETFKDIEDSLNYIPAGEYRMEILNTN